MLSAARCAAALITAHQPAPGPAQHPPPARDPGAARDAHHSPIKLFLADAGYCSEDNLTLPARTG